MLWRILKEIEAWRINFIFNLSGDSGLFLRRNYAKKVFKSCGKNLLISDHVKIYNPENLAVGNDVHLASYVHINAGSGIKIGTHTGIATGTKIFSNIHDYFTNKKSWHITWKKARPIKIGNNVWIGASCVILPEVTIGDNTIIGAGSIVTKDIPSGCLAVGNPAKVIRQLQRDAIA